jgi:hypothetical protein
VLPAAVDDSISIAEDSTARTFNVLSNDENADGGPLMITSVTQPQNGTVEITAEGDAITFAPTSNFSGETSFSYTVNGGSTANVAVNVREVDDPPTAVADAFTVTEDDAASTVDVLANDLDVDDGTTAITGSTQPLHGTVVPINDSTALRYTPAANFSGSDSFTYTLNGGSTASVALTVTGVDDLPVAVDDRVMTTSDTSLTFDVRTNDDDIDGGPISVDSITQPSSGTATIEGSGSLRYVPGASFSGNDSFTYVLNGGSTATVLVLVSAPADLPPTGVDDTATVAEDSGPSAINVLANDQNADGGPLAIMAVMQPANGTVVITGGGSGLTFQPAPNFTGPTGFLYTLNGGSTALVSVTVTPIDDAAVASADTLTVDEDSAATPISVLANDFDIDGGAPFVITGITQPGNGVSTLAAGGITYRPNANFAGTDSFTYTITGGASATVTVIVTPVDDAPVALADAFTVAEDSAATALAVMANDTDIDGGPATITSAMQPENGTVVVAADGSGLTFRPAANFNGVTSFNYTRNGGSSAVVTVTVTPVPDNGTAVNDAYVIEVDATVTSLDVLTNDLDPDGAGLQVVSLGTVLNGTASIAPGGQTINFTPAPGFDGVVSFQYTIAGGSTATVSVDVRIEDPYYQPFAVYDTTSVSENSGFTTVNVLSNDGNVTTNTFVIGVTGTSTHGGTVQISPSGKAVRYRPAPGYYNFCSRDSRVAHHGGKGGDDTFTYTITGGSTATVYVTVFCDQQGGGNF